MNILIHGLGSIGQRHIRILKKIGKNKFKFFTFRDSKKNIIINDNLRTKKVKSVAKYYNVKIINFSEIPKRKIKIAYICTPPSDHASICLKLLKLKCNLFIEKPIFNDLKLLKKISREIKINKNIIHVGYQLKFHPGIKILKKIIQLNKLGKITNGTFYFGEYPGNVRRYEDFTESHMAKRKLGGGALLALSHHLNLAIYLLGPMKIKFSTQKNTKNFKINVEDTFKAVLTSKNNSEIQFNLNFLDAIQQNFIILNFKKGTVIWDYVNKYIKISRYDKKKVDKHIFNNFKRNKMFVDQSSHFINKVKNRLFDLKSFKESVETVKLISNLKKF